MTCTSCKGTGDADQAREGRMRCFECNGIGSMCDTCGEACDDIGADECNECLGRRPGEGEDED